MCRLCSADAVALFAFAGLAAAAAADEQTPGAPQIQVVAGRDGLPTALHALGLPHPVLAKLKDGAAEVDFGHVFAVFLVDDALGAKPLPLLGTYTVDGQTLSFVPRYPLRRGHRYRAVISLTATSAAAQGKVARKAADTTSVTFEFVVPAEPPPAATKVSHIYPSADVLPENLLRFYFHFSAPMSRGDVYRYFRLLDENGRAVSAPFLELGEELWDRQGRRLTLLLDPARVKRGLKPREEAGPVLVVGREYTLVVSGDWPDASGRPLLTAAQKKFSTGAAVTEAIDPRAWKVQPPPAASREPLVVTFPRPLDHALVQHAVSIRGPDAETLSGDVEVSDRERRWEFHPQQPWRQGAYRLVVEGRLEDVCGNQIGRPFEVDRSQVTGDQSAPASTEIPFVVGR
ncbi:MAG: Ig-like domain-containing protein [Planctomycetaceae bacterium]